MFDIIIKYEHFNGLVPDLKLPGDQSHEHCFPRKRESENAKCISILPKEVGHHLSLSYYIGVDWIVENEQAIYVEPKFNKDSQLTNYLAMLVKVLQYPESLPETRELFEIRLNKPFIEIEQHQDLITPLIVVQFLNVIQSIVRKGLKKSFYKVEKNLTGRIKGKILLGHSIKQNLVKNKTLKTVCQYEEFGFDGFENRLLKKALLFVQRYLPTLSLTGLDKYSQQILGFTMPAFYSVSDEIDVNEIKQSKPNIFYREYADGISLARLILKRFGYNITRTEQKGKIKTPPFWIDMSKLFEMYVLALLRERFNHQELTYHFTTNWQELDFIINTSDFKLVADAKYRAVYKTFYDKDDIRQVSGYARMQSVYSLLKKPQNEIIDCLIFYPDPENGHKNLKEVNLKEVSIKQFVNFYKVPVILPVINKRSSNFINDTKEGNIVFA